MGAEDPIDRIEHQIEIDEAALAADADKVVADADMRVAEAREAGASAETPEARLAAQLEEDGAHVDAIRAKTASSRADWELNRMDDDPTN